MACMQPDLSCSPFPFTVLDEFFETEKVQTSQRAHGLAKDSPVREDLNEVGVLSCRAAVRGAAASGGKQ